MIRRPRIAFVTCAALTELDPDDRILRTAVEAQGLDVVPAVWDDPAVDWSDFALILLRSPWDYHERHAAFLDWVARAGRAAPTWNAPEVVAWNSDKTYLRGLAARGVPTVPTRWLSRGERVDLAAVLAEAGWLEAIVKPTVGLGSSGLIRFDAHAAGGGAQAHLDELLASGDAMLQPFVPTLETEGELSLVYLGGSLSHTVRKRPRAGEFRVQSDYGAVATAATPTAAQLAVAEAALACVEGEPRYARVDLVAGDGGAPWLMELELIEPALYLEVDGDAAGRLARMLAEAVAAPAARAAS
jgi:glutathione synthase/RimK-type ligase-like ATP-grasp enzyme